MAAGIWLASTKQAVATARAPPPDSPCTSPLGIASTWLGLIKVRVSVRVRVRVRGRGRGRGRVRVTVRVRVG